MSHFINRLTGRRIANEFHVLISCLNSISPVVYMTNQMMIFYFDAYPSGEFFSEHSTAFLNLLNHVSS